MSLFSTISNNWNKVKSKKDLKQGMVLRIPWPDGALDNEIGFKELSIVRMAGNGNPVIETPSGGHLEIDNLKEIYWKKGTDTNGDQKVLPAADGQGRPPHYEQVLYRDKRS